MNRSRNAALAKNAATSKALDAEIDKIAQERKVRGERSLAECLALLNKLAQVAARNKSAFTKTLIGGIASTIVTVLLLVAMSEFRYHWGLASALPVGAVAAYLLARAWQLRSLRLNEGFRTTITPFLKIIAGDLDPKRPVELRLNLSGPTKDKIVSKETIPPGRFSKVARSVYVDPWCRFSGHLANQGKLIFQISDVYRLDSRRYSIGGKIKWKKVWKKRVRVTAELIPGHSLVFDRAAAEAVAKKHKAVTARAGSTGGDTYATGKFKLEVAKKAGSQAGRLTRQFKFKEINAPPKETVSPDDLVGMFFQLASMLRPARQRSALS